VVNKHIIIIIILKKLMHFPSFKKSSCSTCKGSKGGEFCVYINALLASVSALALDNYVIMCIVVNKQTNKQTNKQG